MRLRQAYQASKESSLTPCFRQNSRMLPPFVSARQPLTANTPHPLLCFMTQLASFSRPKKSGVHRVLTAEYEYYGAIEHPIIEQILASLGPRSGLVSAIGPQQRCSRGDLLATLAIPTPRLPVADVSTCRVSTRTFPSPCVRGSSSSSRPSKRIQDRATFRLPWLTGEVGAVC
jgi:hypothetical protein